MTCLPAIKWDDDGRCDVFFKTTAGGSMTIVGVGGSTTIRGRAIFLGAYNILMRWESEVIWEQVFVKLKLRLIRKSSCTEGFVLSIYERGRWLTEERLWKYLPRATACSYNHDKLYLFRAFVIFPMLSCAVCLGSDQHSNSGCVVQFNILQQ